MTRYALGFLLSTFVVPPCAAVAQDAQETGEALSVPVFESVDPNGVDLITGMLRVRSPQMTVGSGDEQFSFGLEWTGRSWRLLGFPMINKEDGKYFVTYGGVTEEFKGYTANFEQRRPITGSTLDCRVHLPDKLSQSCMYINRLGDVVMFKGMDPLGTYPGNYGKTVVPLGNIGMVYAEVTSGSNPNLAWQDPSGQIVVRNIGFGQNLAGGPGFDSSYYFKTRVFTLGDQSLTITTSNHDGTDTDDHYLMPKGATQSFADAYGATWQYTINDKRELTTVQPPNGLAATTYTYNGDHRVSTATNPAGIWTYGYSSDDGYRTVTVTTPTGRSYSVKSHIDNGYVKEYRELTGPGAPRLTQYDYDSGFRLTQVTYPELNRDVFEYDARGNVLFKRSYPKPLSTDPILVWQSGYAASCTNRVLCNRPTFIIDPKGYRTDFEYAPPETITILRPMGGVVVDLVTVDYGHGKPVVITQPAPVAGGVRPTTTNTYSLGRLATSSTCISAASCAGTADEVKTTIDRTILDINAVFQTNLVLVQKSITVTSDGVSRRTCYDIDVNGRVVGETPPSAGLTSCGGASVNAPAISASAPETGSTKTAPIFSQ